MIWWGIFIYAYMADNALPSQYVIIKWKGCVVGPISSASKTFLQSGPTKKGLVFLIFIILDRRLCRTWFVYQVSTTQIHTKDISLSLSLSLSLYNVAKVMNESTYAIGSITSSLSLSLTSHHAPIRIFFLGPT